jgi:hypothetical protein
LLFYTGKYVRTYLPEIYTKKLTVSGDYLYNKKGDKKINDNALIALALLVAESDPKQKEIMTALIGNMVGNNP